MYTAQLEAYRSVQKTTMTGREVEAEVLTKAALQLRDCRDSWDAADRGARFEKAIKYNQLIWSIFQSELARQENPLPRKLREDLLSLSAFVDKRTFEVLAYPAPEKLTILVDINLNIAAGLRDRR